MGMGGDLHSPRSREEGGAATKVRSIRGRVPVACFARTSKITGGIEGKEAQKNLCSMRKKVLGAIGASKSSGSGKNFLLKSRQRQESAKEKDRQRKGNWTQPSTCPLRLAELQDHGSVNLCRQDSSYQGKGQLGGVDQEGLLLPREQSKEKSIEGKVGSHILHYLGRDVIK